MNRKAKRAALLNESNAIVAGAKAAGRDMTAEEATTVQGKIAEIKALDAEIAAAAASEALAGELAGFGTPEVEKPETGGVKAKSLGDNFVQTLKSKGLSLKTPGTVAAPEIRLKAATDVQATGGNTGAYGVLLTDVDKDFVFPKRERLVVADLLQGGTVGGNAITYPVYGALEGGTGMVGEGGLKPQMHVADPTWRTDALGEAAGWFKLTDDMAEDLEYVASEINTTALYDLAVKEEAQLLNGNGTAPQLRGLLNRSGIQTYTTPALTSNADAIFHAMSLVQTATGFVADAVVINPANYEALRLAKDGNDQYYGGGFFAGQYGNGQQLVLNPPLWGRTTVVTSAITAGTVLVGAFKTAKVFRKGGVRVESTNSHADDFVNDKITVRVRERLGLQVKYPAAFVKLTLI